MLHSSYCFVFKPINYDDYLAAYSFPINYNNEIIGTCIPVTVDGWDSLLLLDMTSGRMSKKCLTLCAFYNASHLAGFGNKYSRGQNLMNSAEIN